MRSALLRVVLTLILAVGFLAEQSIANGGPAPSPAPALELVAAASAAMTPSDEPGRCAIPALGCAVRSGCMCSTMLGQHVPQIEAPSRPELILKWTPSRRLTQRTIPPESPPPKVRS